MVAGDPERLVRARRLAEGIPVDAETWREIVEAAGQWSASGATLLADPWAPREMNPWRQFWDRATALYTVNDRHRAVHYRQVAATTLAVRAAAARLDAAVLDYGCGDALDAARVAARAGGSICSTPVPEVVARLRARFAGGHCQHPAPRRGAACALPRRRSISSSSIRWSSICSARARRGAGRRSAASCAATALIVADVVPPDARRHRRCRGPAANRVCASRVPPCGARRARATFFSDYRRLRQPPAAALTAKLAFLQVWTGRLRRPRAGPRISDLTRSG